MANNQSLHKAARAQQDEFYTQMSDIEEELQHYSQHFEGKKIFCNCDDPYESNFFKYFALRFNELKLARLTATCYNGSPVAQQQLSLFEEEQETPKRTPYLAEITKMRGVKNIQDLRKLLERNVGSIIRKLEGTGDFISYECVDLLKECDIVVTNPPHSLLREFVALLMHYGKKFIIVANNNAITYKEIFPLFMQNKLWLGRNNSGMAFRVPDSYEPRATRYWEEKGEDGKIQKWRSLGNICWFTNLEHGKRHEPITLTKSYASEYEHYPHYDNYDAIEVSRVDDIPYDYEGVMGVPITFMGKYNPEQFEILGCTYIYGDPGCHFSGTSWNAQINGKDIYKRLFIRRKTD